MHAGVAERWEYRVNMTVRLPKGYKPADDEPFMNRKQREYFRRKLLAWREELLKESTETLQHLQEDNVAAPDMTDRASAETERSLELRTRDRERKLLKKIEQSLRRIEDGTYGWCEETGEPIGIPRLLARPTATLTIEAQSRRELKQKLYGD